jgi:hypothetical protein
MPGKNVKIRSREGGEFDCYIAAPVSSGKVPAIVLASAVHGVDQDMRAIADHFAAHGYIAFGISPRVCVIRGESDFPAIIPIIGHMPPSSRLRIRRLLSACDRSALSLAPSPDGAADGVRPR